MLLKSFFTIDELLFHADETRDEAQQGVAADAPQSGASQNAGG